MENWTGTSSKSSEYQGWGDSKQGHPGALGWGAQGFKRKRSGESRTRKVRNAREARECEKASAGSSSEGNVLQDD
eukprot:768142-Hanusia_phi.AAC.3